MYCCDCVPSPRDGTESTLSTPLLENKQMEPEIQKSEDNVIVRGPGELTFLHAVVLVVRAFSASLATYTFPRAAKNLYVTSEIFVLV